MNQRITGLVVAVVGGVFLWLGWQEQQSLGSNINQFFTGSPSDRALWYLIGGGALLVIGLLLAGGVVGLGGFSGRRGRR